jgi:RNA polymerase sigma-70 factor (ECF subfamily)
MGPDSENPIGSDERSPSRKTGRIGDTEDLDLITRMQSGDQDAISQLFARYSGMVYSVALRVLSDAGEAEDVTQEIFVQIWRNPGAFIAGKGSLGGWLVVVARHRAIDVLRRRKPSEPIELFALPSKVNVAAESEQRMLLEKVRAAMSFLPEEQRKSLELAFFEGLSHSEVAAKTGDPLGTVKTRIRLALITIRKALNA